MKKNFVMHGKLLSALIEKVHEENIPVNITTGKSFIDYNGDKQVDVFMEYDDKNATLINEVICNSINSTFGLI